MTISIKNDNYYNLEKAWPPPLCNSIQFRYFQPIDREIIRIDLPTVQGTKARPDRGAGGRGDREEKKRWGGIDV